MAWRTLKEFGLRGKLAVIAEQMGVSLCMPGVFPPPDELLFDPKSPKLKLIAGDASDRKFYRMRLEKSSVICMQFPSWQGGYGGDPLSWLGMHRTLDDWGLPLPRVVKVDEGNCCIWTEDLGDQFLNANQGGHWIDSTDPASSLALQRYRDALDLLLNAQYPEPQVANLLHPARDRFFDETKLLFELRFFGQHFLRGMLSLDDEPYVEEWTQLARRIAKRERVLCHRDYHARNVLISNNQLYWIDFQDARMGPHSYDVVSLLRDSYVKITPESRESLMKHYFAAMCEKRSERQKPEWSWEEFVTECSEVGLQRNVKALGSFAYLHRVKNKKVYLSFIDHTLKTILTESESGPLVGQMPKTFDLLQSLHDGRQSKAISKILKKEKIGVF